MCPLLVIALCFASIPLLPQQLAPATSAEPDKSLPDLLPMMQQVIVHERASEAARPNYLFHQWLGSVEGDGYCDPYPANYPSPKTRRCFGSGSTAVSGEDRESEVFWLRGVRISRLLSVSGFNHHDRKYSHTLSTDELRSENARIDEELAQVAKAHAAGDTEAERKASGFPDEVHLSRLLELGNYSNLRRSEHWQRSTLLVDYTGGTCIGTCTPLDSAARYITGTLSIDEDDLAVVVFDGVFTETWIEAGSGGYKVLKDSDLTYWASRMADGMWFPTMMSIGSTTIRGRMLRTTSSSLRFKDYRKFRVTSTILPDFALVPDGTSPQPPSTIPKP